MNKSDSGDNKGTIFLMDDLAVTRKKIMSAKTDNLNQVKFDEENQPGISNLISILAKITDKDISSIEKRFANKGYGEFKKEVADKVCEPLAKIQSNFAKYNNKELLDQFVKIGADKARVTARETLTRTTKALGLN